MKGDFSRLPAAPSNVDGVYLQQGRVLLDADWNTQVQVNRRRDATLIRDLIGEAGAPEASAGFQITPRYAVRLRPPALDATPATPQGAPANPAGAATPPAREAIKADLGAPPPATLTLEINLRPMAAGLLVDWPNALTLTLGANDDGTFFPTLVTATGGQVLSTTTISADRFTTLAVVIQGTRQTLYIDGAPVGSSQIAPPQGAALTPDAVFWIGGPAPGGAADAANGDVADLRVWRGARTAQALRAGAFERFAAQPDLLLYHLFEPNFQTTAPTETPAQGEPGAATVTVPADARCAPCDVWIGAGRYYVDGVLARNPTTIAYSGQPGRPAPPDLAGGASWLFYLDVWDRFETALQASGLRDPALGGPDTTGWIAVQGLVRALSGTDAALKSLWEDLPRGLTGAASISRPDPLSSILNNSLYCLEVHHGGAVYGAAGPDAAAQASATAVTLDADGAFENGARLPDALLEPGRWLLVWMDNPSGVADAPPISGLGQLTVGPGGQNRLTGLPAALAQPGLPLKVVGAATYKWSNVNGCLTYPIASWAIEPTQDGYALKLNLASAGDNGFDLTTGDWVELCVDDADITGVPGPVRPVTGVDEASLVVYLDWSSSARRPGQPETPNLPPGQHPLLRRWNAPLDAAGAAFAPPVRPIRQGGDPDVLDCGIKVAFEQGVYRSGDYWAFTTRDVAGGIIAWPGDAPSPRPPAGVLHHYAPLAEVTRQALTDRRTLFTTIGGGATPVGPPTPPLPPPPPPPPKPGRWRAVAASGAPETLAGQVVYDTPWLTVLNGDTGQVWRARTPAAAWEAAAPLPASDPGVAFGVLGYDIWAVGGDGQNRVLSSDGSGVWRAAHRLKEAVVAPGVASLGGVLYVVGGERRGKAGGVIQRLTLDRCDVMGAALGAPRSGARAVAGDERLFILGGVANGQQTGLVDGYDPRSDTCRSLAALETGTEVISAVAWRGEIVALTRKDQTLALQLYDPSADDWRKDPIALPTPPGAPLALFVQNELIHAVSGGGADPAGTLYVLS